MKKEEILRLKEERSKDWRCYSLENSVLFNSYCRDENMVLSNMYPCKIEYNGLIFSSVDHLYHWLMFDGEGKDLKNKDGKNVRDLIYKCSGVCSGFEAKRIVKEFVKEGGVIPQQNLDKRYNTLKTCHIARAKSSREFRRFLRESVGKDLVEFAWWHDAHYGCVENKETHEYEGINACGRIMMKVRDMLISGELGEFDD